MKKMRRFGALMAVTLVLTLVMSFVLVAPVLADDTALDISSSTQVTFDSHYERGNSVLKDSSGNYWLFYGRHTSFTGNYGSGNPDDSNYDIYYKKAASVSALPGATASMVTGADNIHQGQTSCVEYDGKIWVFAADETASDHSIKAWHTADGGANWSEHDTGFDGSGAPHLWATVYDGKIFLAYNAVGSKLQVRTYDGTSWSGASDVSTNEGMPRLYEDSDGDLHMYWCSWGMPAYYIHTYDSGWSTTPDYSITGTTDDDCDPMLTKVGSEYVFIFAPWDGTKQYLKYWTSTSIAGFDGKDQTSAMVMTPGGDGTIDWVDMWPAALADGSDVYVFYGSEASSASRGTGNIFMLELSYPSSSIPGLTVWAAVAAVVTVGAVALLMMRRRKAYQPQ